jgi:hypothetical protein
MSIDDSDAIGFLRQRRNVILMSLTLLFFEMVGLRVTELSLLGNKVEIMNPWVIDFSLVVFYSYFLVRYYQVYLAESRESLLERSKWSYKTDIYFETNEYGNWTPKTLNVNQKINYKIRSTLNFVFRNSAYSDIAFPLHLSLFSGSVTLASKAIKLIQ